MSEFWNYCKFKMSKIMRRRAILNFQVSYFISLIIVTYGSRINDYSMITTGFILFILTSIYHDYASGNWKAELRKEYGKLTRRDLTPLKEKVEQKTEENKDGRE